MLPLTSSCQGLSNLWPDFRSLAATAIGFFAIFPAFSKLFCWVSSYEPFCFKFWLGYIPPVWTMKIHQWPIFGIKPIHTVCIYMCIYIYTYLPPTYPTLPYPYLSSPCLTLPYLSTFLPTYLPTYSPTYLRIHIYRWTLHTFVTWGGIAWHSIPWHYIPTHTMWAPPVSNWFPIPWSIYLSFCIYIYIYTYTYIVMYI